ncbi:hypothetical protein AWB81_05375 [Caballeronia arationis]|uniref:hypothetical protein n=1 Tax=Caballeronia arationis TaxID=1777142 RepID=UPI00074B57AB|nr:hypothetical protein [Caballeronia arationis]SAK96312.1 hypothetical protein AWB81_05375 [Caballeronia arationis]
MSTLADKTPLHPAQRRRLAATLPMQPAHDVVLRPLGGGDAGTVIVSLREDAFLQALFADLRADDWETRLAARRRLRHGADGRLELSLPIHRQHHVALFEAACRMPGMPPVDPRKLAGMGLVLRRLNPADGSLLGWMKSNGQPLGWRFTAAAPGASPGADPDPDPPQRPATALPASAQLAVRLSARRGAAPLPVEDVVPLYVAPPDICRARGRTIVFGVVPVASSERVATASAPDFDALSGDDLTQVLLHFSEYLKARPDMSMPRAGQSLDPAWNVLGTPASADTDEGRLYAFGVFLQQLQVELGAFSGAAAARALLAELAQLVLPMGADADGNARPDVNAADFAAAAADILVGGNANASGLTMPTGWPRIDDAAGERLTRCALACLSARVSDVAPHTPKFDRDDALYVVRAFARMQNHAQCASALIWSTCYCEPFRVVPWWDGDGPPMRLAMPPLSKLKMLRPSVTFEVPPEIANLLNGDMKKLASGEGSRPSGIGIGWLCSFSLPIIFLCAFIILNLFLKLFDICFFWMAYVKICIPYPKPK